MIKLYNSLVHYYIYVYHNILDPTTLSVMRIPHVISQYILGHSDKSPQIGEHVIIDNGSGCCSFVKSYRDNVQMEYIRAKRIHEQARTSGVFISHQPIACVESKNLMVWEYMPHLVGLRDFLLGERRRCFKSTTHLVWVLRNTGRALAIIHRSLNTNEAVNQEPLIPKIQSPFESFYEHARKVLRQSGCTNIHGDFGCANLFV
jgi:hypothetical protein